MSTDVLPSRAIYPDDLIDYLRSGGDWNGLFGLQVLGACRNDADASRGTKCDALAHRSLASQAPICQGATEASFCLWLSPGRGGDLEFSLQ